MEEKVNNPNANNKGKKQCAECGQFKYYNQFEPKTNVCKGCIDGKREGLIKPPQSAEDVFIGSRLRII